MDNCNQALRINFLQEQLLRMKDGTAFGSDELKTELVQLRLVLKTRDQDLRQQNVNRIRATEALNLLQTKVSAARSKADRTIQAVQRQVQVSERARQELMATIQQRDDELHQQQQCVTKLTRELQKLKDEKARDDEMRRNVDKAHDRMTKTLESQMKHAEDTEKSRRARMNESFRQERARLQAQMERMEKERQQLAGETERLRMENVKLTTACEDLTKSSDGLKTDRKAAVRTIDALESELHQRHKLENEHELAIKTLQIQLDHAQAKACKMEEQAAEGLVRKTAARQLTLQDDAEKRKLTRQLGVERRRANEMERAAAALKNENKSLLKAIPMYEGAIASRDKDIDEYKAAVMKHKKQQEHTQHMIKKLYQWLGDSPTVRGPLASTSGKERFKAASLKLDEYIIRMRKCRSKAWFIFH